MKASATLFILVTAVYVVSVGATHNNHNAKRHNQERKHLVQTKRHQVRNHGSICGICEEQCYDGCILYNNNHESDSFLTGDRSADYLKRRFFKRFINAKKRSDSNADDDADDDDSSNYDCCVCKCPRAEAPEEEDPTNEESFDPVPNPGDDDSAAKRKSNHV